VLFRESPGAGRKFLAHLSAKAEKGMSYHTISDLVQSHGLAIFLVAALFLVVWLFHRNEDLQPHRVPLVVAFGLLGIIPLLWLIATLTNNRLAGSVLSVILGMVIVWQIVKIVDRATNDFLGGLLYDIVFSEGPFAAMYRPPRKLPSLRLLQAWRANGFTRKAYRVARRNLVKTENAFPIWLFAAETAAIHFGRVPTAIKIIRRLCRCTQFTDDQKTFAVSHLKGWAAAKGYDLNVLGMKSTHGPSPKPSPLRNINRLRSRGCYQEAKSQLLRLLRHNPDNMAAAVMLVRVYAQDLHERDKAEKLINSLEKKPFISNGVIDFLRNSLNEWLATPITTTTTSIRIADNSPTCGPTLGALRRLLARALGRNVIQPSQADQPRLSHFRKNSPPAFTENLSPDIASLVTEGLLGTAVETLESLIQQKPADFDLRLQLAQVWIVNCEYPKGAERTITAIEGDPGFTAAQKSTARTQLALWSKKYAERNSAKQIASSLLPLCPTRGDVNACP
jgi:hypothetical protein